MGEGKVTPFAVFEMGSEFGNLTVKLKRLLVQGGFEPGRVPPAREPVHQIHVRQNDCFVITLPALMRFREPLNEFPVGRWKELLFVRGTRGEFKNLRQRADLFAGARTNQVKLDGETEARWLVGI